MEEAGLEGGEEEVQLGEEDLALNGGEEGLLGGEEDGGEEGLLGGDEGVPGDGADADVDALNDGIDETPVELDAAGGEAEAAPEAEPEAAAEEEDEDAEAADVADHLKDAIEGSLRLKRMLSRDDTATGGDAKKRKLDGEGPRPIIEAKVRQILLKWNSLTDPVMKHVLDQCTVEELQSLLVGNFVPNKFDQRKQAAELCAQHLRQMKEKKLGGGSRLDVVSAFKHRWQLPLDAEKTLRALSHKDLRYVVNTYDGSQTLQEVIDEASINEVFDDETAENAAPSRSGIKVMGRFNRLELIDPLADCAVFGDANLTFSLNLAKHRKDFGHVGRVIATTFEEVETLRERYKEIDESIRILEEHHAEVYHGVDCTRIALDPRFQGMDGKLGAVYYNFPHSGAVQGFFDSNPMVNWRHENLMRLFFRALRHFMKPGGVVKVASNSGAVGVRYSFIVGGAIENEFTHTETMPFLEWHLHRYGRSYGDRRDAYKRPDAKNNQSYNAQNANADMVYCFAYAPTGAELGKQPIRFPPSLEVLRQCKDGPFKNLAPGTPGRLNLAKQLHQRFLKEISGTHVG